MASSQTKELVSLSGIAMEINSLYQSVEHAYMRTAELLHTAREQFEEADEDGFMGWAIDHTKYSSVHVNNYIRVYDRFAEKIDFSKAENPIPFSSLIELAKQNVPKATVNKVLKQYQNKTPPTVREVKAVVRAALPPAPKKHVVQEKPFVERVATVVDGKWRLRAEALLNIVTVGGSVKENNAETIRIVARHWKQKMHPDKPGGNAELFNQIVKAEKELLKSRGES